MSIIDHLTCSPGTAGLSLEDSLRVFSGIGFRNIELFSRAGSPNAPDLRRDPEEYRALAARYGMRISSFHLPSVGVDSAESFEAAVRAARFAEGLGAEVALFNADTRPIMIEALPRYLDAVADVPVTIAVQNHPGRALETGEDYREVFAGIGDDRRLKGVLEVGAFHHYGWTWQQGYDLLQGRIALVHIKDMVGRQSVPFGSGEVDIPGLIRQMSAVGYRGKFTLEMSVVDKENTIPYTRDAFRYMVDRCGQYYAD